jgi:alpha-galactosidase
MRCSILWTAAILMTAAAPTLAVKPTDAELSRAHAWSAMYLGDAPSADLPFSFTYDGKPSADLLKTWKVQRESKKLDDARTEHTATYTDPTTGLAVTCRAVEYSDFPSVEWTLHFKNTGTADTPILADIKALDAAFLRSADGEFTLHGNKGDFCAPDSYEPFAETLGPGATKQFAPAGGRPTNGQYPYWNIAMADDGLIVVLGWPGQWSAKFERDADKTLRVRAGQELTHFKLHPGEEARSPLVALQYYQGDWTRGQNIWRRWMIAHNIPRPGGKLPQPFTSICMGLQQSEAGEIKNIDSYVSNGIKHDYWWMDAGWYPCKGQWWNTGTWEPDPARFPHGIKAVSDYAHSKGMKLVLWFEPERVAADTWLSKNHPEWILGGAQGGLLNLGNPDVWQWLVNHIDKTIVEQGVDLYRQDFNIDPLAYWRGNDAPDRQGITEIKHVTGYLAFWDELRRRHPDMLIDSCASGGRRDDLETLRRAVPLLRSDFQAPSAPGNPEMSVGNQGHTYGLSMWVPFYGTGEYYNNGYSYRSHLCPAMGVGYDPSKSPVDWKALKKAMDDWRCVAADFYGDYYPLTKYSRSFGAWMAWQFNRPEAGQGMIQAFRHKENPDESIRLKLQGLDADAVYTLTNLDVPGTTEQTGRQLSEEGLPIVLKDRPSAVLITYEKKP